MSHQEQSIRPPSALDGVVERNIQALLERRVVEKENLRWPDRVAQRITAFAGSMFFVALHALVFGLWIIINLGWIPLLPRFDPTFVVLAMIASVEAIFLSTFILITQNHMMKVADRRADLNLQISLLAEHEITRLLKITARLCQRLDIDHANDPELQELTRDVRPEQVLEKIEQREARLASGQRE